MIQELLGEAAAGLIGAAGDHRSKLSAHGPLGCSPSPSPSSNSSPSSSATTAPAASSSTSDQNLRCPRCDSTNTKFCYYNNYNLTQPRHFCKTCRRYWTKGGALRNVPIGGGCRKNKSGGSTAGAGITTSAGKPSSVGKLKTMPSISEMGFSKSGFNMSCCFDHDLISSSSPIFWASSSPHHQSSSSHNLLSLLRPANNQNPNTNPISNSVSHLKEEYNYSASASAAIFQSQMGSHELPSIFRNPTHQEQQQQQQNGTFMVGEIQSGGGLQDFDQRLKSSSSYYNQDDDAPLVMVGNWAANNSSSSSSTILESAPVATSDQLGYWNNPILSWADHLPTTNGAYP